MGNKKFISLFLFVILLFSLFGCSDINYSNNEIINSEYYENDNIDEYSSDSDDINKDYNEKSESIVDSVEYHFRSSKLLKSHYEKHGKEMGFDDMESYEQAASNVINNKDSLFKIETEDGDGVYYLEATNEFVILSKDGFIRTYFFPDAGKDYFDRQ